jgi:peptidyl-tRNA hydrolase, PTH2 family
MDQNKNAIKLEEEYVMYILVNNDLKMDKGKIAAQVGHAVEMLTNTIPKIADKDYQNIYQSYLKNLHKKICLKGTQKDLENYMNDNDAVYVIDAGLTQIPKNSLTVVAFLPSNKNKDRFKNFKLL